MRYKPYFRFSKIILQEAGRYGKDPLYQKMKKSPKVVEELLSNLWHMDDPDKEERVWEYASNIGWKFFTDDDLEPKQIKSDYGFYYPGMEDDLIYQSVDVQRHGDNYYWMSPKDYKKAQAEVKKRYKAYQKEQEKEQKKIESWIKQTVQTIKKKAKELDVWSIDVVEAKTTSSRYIKISKYDKDMTIRVSDHPPKVSSKSYDYSIHLDIPDEEANKSGLLYWKSGDDLKYVLSMMEYDFEYDPEWEEEEGG